MRALAGSLALALALGSGVSAQRGMGGGFRGGGGMGGGYRGGGGMGGGYRGGGGMGGGYHGGGGMGGTWHGGAFVGSGHPHGGIGFRAGVGRFGFGRFNNAFYSPFWGYGWGWGWPGSWDSSYGYYPSYVADYGYGYPSMGYGYGAYNYNQPASAPVVISQSFTPATPVIHEYPDWGGAASSPPSPPPPGDMPQPAGQAQGPVIYLIAFTDGVIRPALAYWTSGATLNYLGMDHRQKQAPLGSVDRNFSAQLNRERRVPFGLPQ